MKKIIYSLVIMIAAGSLFTSCIEQVEPLGIQDMRFAKAEYIRALKDLRAADAELVRAEAAHEQARARYVDAMTANLNADTEYQKLLNEYQQLINEARQDTNDFISAKTASAIDSIKKEIELRELTHAKDIADAERELAFAREQLRVALRDIALYSQSLTPAEQSALAAAVYMYETAFEETADQTMVVMQAQRTLDSLKLVREVGPDTAYDKSSKAYIGAVEKWNKDIEKAKVEQALVAALLLAVPDSLVYDDVDGWKEQIDELVKDSTELAYNQYQVKEEMANYYVTYIHDNVAYFDTVASQWKKEHKDVDPGNEPKKTDAKYWTTNTQVLSVDPFETKPANAAYAKFIYLLKSYEGKKSPANMKKNIVNYSGDTLYLTVNQKVDGFRGFVMGDATATEDSLVFSWKTPSNNDTTYKAMYGLKGAVSVLERDKVLNAYKADTTERRKARDAAKEAWETSREVLINGLPAYEPYIEALALEEMMEEAEDYAAEAMATAVQTLKTAFSSVNTTTLSRNDSVRIINAFVEFAAARELYLDYEFDSETQPHDSTYFVFAKSWDAYGEAVLDSVKFVDLTYDDLAAHKYDPDKDGDDGHKFFPQTNTAPKQSGIANIANQLLNPTIAAIVKDNPASATAWDEVIIPNINKDTYNAFYTAYQYVDGDPGTMKNADGSEYESSDLTEAKAAVYAAVGTYAAIYNAFWDRNDNAVTVDGDGNITGSAFDGDYDLYFAATTAEAKATALEAAEEAVATGTPLKADAYSLATFTEPTNVVTYAIDGTNVDWSNAIGAILGSVEKAINGNTTYTNGNEYKEGDIVRSTGTMRSQAFWGYVGDGTLFNDYMYAEYAYQQSQKDVTGDLAKIKAWVESVEAAYEADAAAAGQFKENLYNQDVKDYNDKKAKHDKYLADLKEFTGSAKQAPIMLTMPTVDPTDFASIDQVLIGGAVEPVTAFGYYPGEWNKKLGGKQLELAKELFPNYPEELAAWDAEIKIVKDNLKHYEILIKAAKDAYFASAKLAGEDVASEAGLKPTNFDQLVENYKEANKRYRERLIGIIEDLQADIETLEERIAKFNQGLPQLDIAIAEAEKELKVETARLQGYEQALAYAKANLEHLLEYIKSLDVNFVVPAVDFDD